MIFDRVVLYFWSGCQLSCQIGSPTGWFDQIRKPAMLLFVLEDILSDPENAIIYINQNHMNLTDPVA